MRLATEAPPLIAAITLACSGPGSSGAVVDDAGRSVALDRPARRIVSLSPSTTELLFAIGAGDRVVGRTQWCEDPVEALAVPSVGDGLDPNVELIVTRRPDLVVFYHSGQNAAAIDKLSRMGIATVSIRLDRMDDVRRAAHLLGGLTGERARADSLAAALEADLVALRRSRTGEPTRVLLLAWDAPPIIIGGGSFLSELVHLAGGQNVFEDVPQASAPVSLEAIAARPADLLLLVGEAEPSFLGRPEWQSVETVRENRYATVSGTEFSWPSFRSATAVRQLRELLVTGR